MRAAGLAVVSVCAFGFVSCGGENALPSPSTHVQTASVLTGWVSEARPFNDVIAGAKVEFVDGANAGKSAIADAHGKYEIAGLAPGTYTVRATAPDHGEQSVGVTLESVVTQDFRLPGLRPRLLTAFWSGGLYRVNVDIQPGRYYVANMVAGFCNVERRSGPSEGDVIAEYWPLSPPKQWIVDILPSDFAFGVGIDCGFWSTEPAAGVQTSIQPGVWLVGSQVIPGRYTATPRNTATPGNGCHWERLKDFSMVAAAILASGSGNDGDSLSVDIKSSDVGFRTDAGCGAWTLTDGR